MSDTKYISLAPWQDDMAYGNINVNPSTDAPSGYGSQYDQLFQNNPYRDLNYKKSFWQTIAEGLGFRTKYDDYVEQAQLNAREYDADVFALMQQNQYNSPTEQSERMREAGLNPDLLGTGDVAPAAQMRNDANGMQPSGADDPTQVLGIISSVSQGVLNLIPQVLSFATQISQLKGIRAENDAKELAFGQSAMQAAEEFFAHGITEQDYRDAFEKNDWTNILDAAKSNSQHMTETLFSSKKARKRFQMLYGMHSNSLIAKMQKYKTYGEFEDARSGIIKTRASMFFNDDDEVMENLMKAFLNPVEHYQQIMNELNEAKALLRDPNLEQGLENMQMQNQLAYENAIDPTLQAKAENATNDYVEQQQKIMKATDDLFAEIMDNLKKHDNWWSKIAMSLVGMARAQLLSGMSLQFGRQKHYELNGDTGVYTEKGSSSFNVSK